MQLRTGDERASSYHVGHLRERGGKAGTGLASSWMPVTFTGYNAGVSTSIHRKASIVPTLDTLALSPATLVDRSNELMRAWELGDTETYRNGLAADVRMSIPAYDLDISGFEALWGLRANMKPLEAGPLDLHVLDTHRVEGRTVRALSHVISRESGQFTQHAEVVFTFDEGGLLAHYHQDVLWIVG